MKFNIVIVDECITENCIENWEDFMFIKKYNPKIKKFENLERRRVKCFGKKYCTPDRHCWNVPNNYPNMFLTNTLINIEYKERI